MHEGLHGVLPKETLGFPARTIKQNIYISSVMHVASQILKVQQWHSHGVCFAELGEGDSSPFSV